MSERSRAKVMGLKLPYSSDDSEWALGGTCKSRYRLSMAYKIGTKNANYKFIGTGWRFDLVLL